MSRGRTPLDPEMRSVRVCFVLSERQARELDGLVRAHKKRTRSELLRKLIDEAETARWRGDSQRERTRASIDELLERDLEEQQADDAVTQVRIKKILSEPGLLGFHTSVP